MPLTVQLTDSAGGLETAVALGGAPAGSCVPAEEKSEVDIETEIAGSVRESEADNAESRDEIGPLSSGPIAEPN